MVVVDFISASTVVVDSVFMAIVVVVVVEHGQSPMHFPAPNVVHAVTFSQLLKPLTILSQQHPMIVVVVGIVVVVEQGHSPTQAAPHILTLKHPRPLEVSQQQLADDIVVLAPEQVPKQHFMSLFWQL